MRTQQRLEFVRERCPLTGAHCLDIGAGVGEFVQRLASEGALASGLEPSRLRRDFARLRFGFALNSLGHKQIFRPVQLVRLAEKTDFHVVELRRGLRRDRIVLTCRKPSFQG